MQDRAQVALQLEAEFGQNAADVVEDVGPHQPPEPPPAQPIPNTSDSSEEVPARPTGTLHAHSLVMAAKNVVGETTWAGPSKNDTLQRLRALNPLMKAFITKTLLFMKILSKAQIDGGHDLEPGSHNYVMHQLGEENYKHNLSASRISRYASWTTFLERVRSLVRAVGGKNCRHCNPEALQTILPGGRPREPSIPSFGDPETRTGDAGCGYGGVQGSSGEAESKSKSTSQSSSGKGDENN